jgi:WD40 repeat protein
MWLPNEIVVNILSYMSIKELFHFSLVGRACARFIDDTRLWKLLFARDLPERLTLRAPPTLTFKELYRMPFVVRSNIENNCPKITTLDSHESGIFASYYRDSLLLSGDGKGNVKVRTKGQDGLFQTVQTIQSCCKSEFFQISPDQEHLFSHGATVLKIYKRAEKGDFEEIQSIDIDGTEIRHFKMDGRTLTVSSGQNSVVYCKGLDGLFYESTRLSGIHLVFVSCDYLFAAFRDETVQILKRDAQDNYKVQQNFTKAAPTAVFPSWVFFENGQLIVGSSGGVFQIWKQKENGWFTGPEDVNVLDDVNGIHFMNYVACMTVRADDIFIGMSQGQLIVLTKDRNGVFQKQLLSSTFLDIIGSIITYENYMISGHFDKTVKFWEKTEGSYKLFQTLEPGPAGVSSLSMDDNKLVIGYLTGEVEIRDFYPK